MSKLILGIVTILALSVCSFSQVNSKDEKVKSATQSISTWLTVVDSGAYSKSCASTGSLFQKQVSDSQWVDALNKARKPFGSMISRSVKKAEYMTSLPGVPDGEYVVAVFQTKFKKKKNAQETTTAVYENDSWKIVGYFIK